MRTFPFLVLLYATILHGTAAETACDRYWIKEHEEVARGSRVLLDSQYYNIRHASFVLSIRVERAVDAPNSTRAPGGLILIAYGKSPKGNHLYYKKELTIDDDGEVHYLAELPAVSDMVKVVVFRQEAIDDSAQISAVIVDGGHYNEEAEATK